MTAQQRAWSWGIGIAVALVLLYLLRGVMLPFVAGMAVAYFLDPACDWLEAKGTSRTTATVTITASFFVFVILALVLIGPVVFSQLAEFFQKLPSYFNVLRDKLLAMVAALEPFLNENGLTDLRKAVSQHSGEMVRWAAGLLGGMVTQLESLANLLSLLVITPIVSFYLLRDWDRMVGTIDGWLPRAHAETIREQFREIDRTLAGFVRGQVTVCLLLGLFYGTGLLLVGLDFGFLVGFLTGLVSFVPFFGMLLGFVVGMALAVAQFGDLLQIGLVAAVFVAGQVIEGNFLTPKMVGERVGLHAVWVIFALLAGGALFGFVGVLLAVPVAAVAGVLIRFGVDRYLESPLYLAGAGAGKGTGTAKKGES